MFPKIGVPPNHPLKNRVFHYKPSILGYPLETPIYVTIYGCLGSSSLVSGALAVQKRSWKVKLFGSTFHPTNEIRWAIFEANVTDLHDAKTFKTMQQLHVQGQFRSKSLNSFLKSSISRSFSASFSCINMAKYQIAPSHWNLPNSTLFLRSLWQRIGNQDQSGTIDYVSQGLNSLYWGWSSNL